MTAVVDAAKTVQSGAVLDRTRLYIGGEQSGLGREGGAFGLEEFLETKAIQR